MTSRNGFGLEAIKTKEQLFRILGEQGSRFVNVQTVEGIKCGIVSSVEREDGSGKRFNVRLFQRDCVRTYYVRFDS